MPTKSYREFLESKSVIAVERGYDGPVTLNPNLKPHARDIAAWMIRGGARACFASFGLHKTSIQLQVCESLLDVFPGECALIVCPLGVRREFRKEAVARGFKRQPVAPGRMYCVHAKDRIVYGTVSGDGMYTVNPFSDKCVEHLRRHGFRYCSRITVVTDVVRENNQTYRLGWTENSKDGTKMGVGSPEYVLLFRKLPTDRANAYADVPVAHEKPHCLCVDHDFDPVDGMAPCGRCGAAAVE